MEAYRAVSVTLGLIIGLGLARLLSSSVSLFKSREVAVFDWIPLVWAGSVFFWQIQFWWAIIELQGLVKSWTIAEFTLLISMTLVLYVAAALVLPTSEIIHGDTLTKSFERDGRWALTLLSFYFVLAIGVNWWLFGIFPLGYPATLNVVLVVLPLVYLRSRKAAARAWVTVMYAVVGLWAAWAMSPHSYT